MNKIKILIVFTFLLQGCSGLMTKDEVAKIEKELTPVAVAPVVVAPVVSVETKANIEDEALTKYSELTNMAPPSDRQYKRMTRKKMEEESDLNSSAGSLWKMEGQTSYLFAENKHRREGDPTLIKMEGSALKIIENKVGVISDLLNQLEEQKRKSEEELKHQEEEKIKLAQLEAEKQLRKEKIARGEIVVDPFDEQQNQASDKAIADNRKPSSVAGVNIKAPKEEKVDLKEVELIPAKIVEKVAADTYRIRGQQFLTIKKKPYKVIATALVRAEDFNDDGVSSNKLIDAQYDVIHVKRATNE